MYYNPLNALYWMYYIEGIECILFHSMRPILLHCMYLCILHILAILSNISYSIQCVLLYSFEYIPFWNMSSTFFTWESTLYMQYSLSTAEHEIIHFIQHSILTSTARMYPSWSIIPINTFKYDANHSLCSNIWNEYRVPTLVHVDLRFLDYFNRHADPPTPWLPCLRRLQYMKLRTSNLSAKPCISLNAHL